jgi:F-type H+-transporting ATPase subunit epsilon
MATLKLEIVTPDGKAFESDVEVVHLPGVEGEMDVLPQHEALVTALDAGELLITRNGKTESMAIGEGFAEVTADRVSVLTDGAVNAKDIDEKAAEMAVKRAEELLKSNTLEGEELEATQAALARSLAQINVKRRRHAT